VGKILRTSGVPTIEFRASIVIGAGSLSYELVRALVERLPVMITPRWVAVKAQPIAIDDLLEYLVQAFTLPLEESRVFEIGGTDQMSYGELMREYARQRGLRRIMIPVPFLTPRLSSLWLGLVTPVYARIGRKLIDSIKKPVGCSRHDRPASFSDPSLRDTGSNCPRHRRRAWKCGECLVRRLFLLRAFPATRGTQTHCSVYRSALVPRARDRRTGLYTHP
jgi:uncharacterized protein YbjT (DUF2867 family)